jgi:GntR family transcriptional regulator / MocR family aminotransferase
MARRSEGVMLPRIRENPVRRRDVYRTLRAAILEGVLAAGERLPSSRQAARDYGVSRGMIEDVYLQLSVEGFLDRTVGRGTFVAASAAQLAPPSSLEAKKRRSPSPSQRGLALGAAAACREPETLRPFNAGVADTSEFPWKTWQRLQSRVAREEGRAAMGFADPRGVPALRAAIARHLAHVRGVRCTPDGVVVFNSAQQALYALSVLLLDRGDSVWMEDPGYLGARAAFDLAGAKIVSVPVDEEGLAVELGIRRAPRARLVYVTPAHQYPTGVALSLERRIALLDWAERRNSWIVEDDYDGEFRYAGEPLTTLHSLDPQARVLHVGTLSKSMFVSLRLAYAVVPPALVEPLANVRTQLDGFTPAPTQLVTSLFMEEGHFSSHLRRMRAAYGAKRAELVAGLAPLRSHGWTWPDNPAGFHLLIRHPDAAHVAATAKAGGLDVALLRSYRLRESRDDGLFLRFAGLSPASLRQGVSTLVSAERRTRS